MNGASKWRWSSAMKIYELYWNSKLTPLERIQQKHKELHTRKSRRKTTRNCSSPINAWILFFLKELMIFYLPRKHVISWKKHTQTWTMWRRRGCALTRDDMSYFKRNEKLTRNKGKNHYQDSYGRGNQVSWFILV